MNKQQKKLKAVLNLLKLLRVIMAALMVLITVGTCFATGEVIIGPTRPSPYATPVPTFVPITSFGIGSTPVEVLAVWGRPCSWSEYATNGNDTVFWNYPNGAIVMFTNDRVSGWYAQGGRY